ncbi:hypothetical protein ACUSIJ_29435 [Pseudochelatococcus sp. B33]
MQVVVDTNGRTRLDEPDDFRNFRVTIEDGTSYKTLKAAIDTIGRLDNEGTAWIHETALRKLGRVDTIWQDQLTAMIAGAARHGWIDPGTGDIRAHIVGSISG